MITETNVPNLLRLICNNENAEHFNLGFIINICETYGCLVGNDFVKTYPYVKEISSIINRSYKEYGLSPIIWNYLFNHVEYDRSNMGINIKDFKKYRDCFDKEAALQRVRKFVYYVLHKRELLYDDNGCIRESARRQEGNHNILKNVTEKVLSF